MVISFTSSLISDQVQGHGLTFDPLEENYLRFFLPLLKGRTGSL